MSRQPVMVLSKMETIEICLGEKVAHEVVTIPIFMF